MKSKIFIKYFLLGYFSLWQLTQIVFSLEINLQDSKNNSELAFNTCNEISNSTCLLKNNQNEIRENSKSFTDNIHFVFSLNHSKHFVEVLSTLFTNQILLRESGLLEKINPRSPPFLFSL